MKKDKNTAKKDKATKFRKAIDAIQSGASGQQRVKALASAVKAAPDSATARSMSLLLYKERALTDMAAVRTELGQRLGDLNESDQPRAIARASAAAIRNVQRPLITPSPGRSQRQVLRGAFTGDYKRETLPRDSTELPSQTRMARESERAIAEAEEGLSKATTVEGREHWSFRLTRAKLIEGHRQGVI